MLKVNDITSALSHIQIELNSVIAQVDSVPSWFKVDRISLGNIVLFHLAFGARQRPLCLPTPQPTELPTYEPYPYQ